MHKPIVTPRDGSTKPFLGPRQEPGEVEPVGAGAAGGVEVGAGPAAGRVVQLGVESTGLGAVAVMVLAAPTVLMQDTRPGWGSAGRRGIGMAAPPGIPAR
jgi:hypothetical protein